MKTFIWAYFEVRVKRQTAAALSCPTVCIALTARITCTLSPVVIAAIQRVDDEEARRRLRYMHRNPVKRGLVNLPEQWRWSSYRFYFLDEAGPVLVNEGWGRFLFKLP